MDLCDKNGLRYLINKNNHTASIINSPDAKGDINIPVLFEYEGIKYIIISIEKYAFCGDKIKSINFSKEDCQVKVFKSEAFYNISLESLYIPTSLEKIEPGCFFNVIKPFNIVVSDKNTNFKNIEDKYLIQLGKNGFDTLIYVRPDLEEAVIPSSVKFLRPSSLVNNKNLKSLIFTEDSKIESIKYGVLVESLEHLVIPKNLKNIDQLCFQLPMNLIKIEVLKGNPMYLYKDPFLYKKSESGEFDEICFCRRDIDKIESFPKKIKKISSYSFSNCNKLIEMKFQKSSSLETIESYAFYSSFGLSKLILPPSLINVGSFGFYEMKNLAIVYFYSENIKIGSKCFFSCDKLSSVSFSYAKKLFLEDSFPEKTKINVLRDAELTCGIIDHYKSRITYLKDTKSSKDSNSGNENMSSETEIEDLKNKYETMIKEIQQENEQIKKMKEENEIIIKKLKNENEKLKKMLSAKNAEIKKIHKTDSDKSLNISKSSEFELSESDDNIENPIIIKEDNQIKILNAKTINNFLTQKKFNPGSNSASIRQVVNNIYIIKELKNRVEPNKLQAFIDKYQFFSNYGHPNIVKIFGIFSGDENNLPKILLENCSIDMKSKINTKKGVSKIDVVLWIYQIVEGMKFIHFNEMIHLDLKPSNILFGLDGHIKISDIGIPQLMNPEDQINVSDDTLKFMAPEIINKEKYDNKVDVYSFGILIYFILSGGSFIDTKSSKDTKFPPYFTDFAIQLINECCSLKPSDRPSFETISQKLEKNNYSLYQLKPQEIITVKSIVKQHKEKIPSYSA